MVAAQHLLLTKGSASSHLPADFGTSMGCMHSFVWGETYAGFMDALMPMHVCRCRLRGATASGEDG